MSKILLLLISILAMNATALEPWEDRYSNLRWTHDGTLADGSSIPLSDLSYTVYDTLTEMAVCQTDELKCSVLMVWGVCVSYYATATNKTDMLVSARSNVTQELCTESRPGVPPVAPKGLTGGVGASTGVLQ